MNLTMVKVAQQMGLDALNEVITATEKDLNRWRKDEKELPARIERWEGILKQLRELRTVLEKGK